ncbi:MAG: chemotaxis protein CheW [Bacteroidota bacterium]
MALGSNLKPKKLIPEAPAEKKEAVSKQKKTAGKKAIAAKKITNKPNAAGKKTNKKKEVTPKVDQKTLSEEAGSVSPEASIPKSAVETVEATEEIVQAEAIVNPSELDLPLSKSADHFSRQEQIISAYSVYIANELNERKKALRTKYLNEISGLQGKPLQFIVITIGTEKYALDIDVVKEVVPFPAISQTPNTPEHIKGVVNVRGNNFVVFDLATKFQVRAQEISRYLLVLSHKRLKSSVPLSVLPSTFKTNGNQIAHSLETMENSLLDSSYIKGIIQEGAELIYYLDIESLLQNDKAIVVPDNLMEEL